MTLRRFAPTLGLALAVAASPPCAMAQGPTLRHDPFARPVLGEAPAPRVQRAPEPKPKLNLQAVIVAGPHSIANVDGVLVRVGESVKGYRLLEVHDRSAVFERNNARLTLGVGTNLRPAREEPRPEPRPQPAAGEAK